ncbi:hypothetical protein AXF23_10725 [Prevotella sp. oral taxon 313]|nr:hypothetical protein AXF23_10725 [Prevotella sp. oral taxon 313]
MSHIVLLSSANIDKKKDIKRQKTAFIITKLYVFTNQKEGRSIAQQSSPTNYFHDKKNLFS